MPSRAAFAGLLLVLLGLSHSAALNTIYTHDAVTTYCWAIQSNATKLTPADRTPEHAGTENCAMEMVVQLNETEIIPNRRISVTWSVVANFNNGNVINNPKLAYGKAADGKTAQIVHSNIHTCEYGTGCDPFFDGEGFRDQTENKIANFTDNRAEFTDSMLFKAPGEYSVLAHIVLPSGKPTGRFDYAVYTKVIVLDPSQASPTSTAPPQSIAPAGAANGGVSGGSESTGLTSGALIAIIVGSIIVIVAVAIVTVLLRRQRATAAARYNFAPILGGGAGPDHHKGDYDRPPVATSDTFSAWGGSSDYSSVHTAGTAPTTIQLHSTAAAPPGAIFRRDPHNDYSNATTFSSHPTAPAASRPRRTDSDVEL